MDASSPRYGFQVYVSDVGYVCIRQLAICLSDEPILLHPDEVQSLIEALEETRQNALDYVPPQDL